jgi:hypothetical protein
MKRYPLLRQATEELLTQYLRERELLTKQACSAYVQTQLSYINTNNEDFIGFARFVLLSMNLKLQLIFFFSAEKSVTSGETKRHVTNQVNTFDFSAIHAEILIKIIGTSMFDSKNVLYNYCLVVMKLSYI